MSLFQGAGSIHQFVPGRFDALALDTIEGARHIHKFGMNPVVNTTEEDIWNVGGKETLVTSGVTQWIACDDNTNGVGQTIRVEGLDANWVEQIVNVVLNGNTPVQIGDALNWTRVHRAYQISATPDPVGDVWIAQDDTDFTLGVPQTATNIAALLDFTNAAQQTEKCMFTIPAAHTGLLRGFNASIGTPSGATRTVEIAVEIQEYVGGTTWAPWRRLDEHSMISDATSAVSEMYSVPRGPLAPLTNVSLRATASADSIIRGDMDITIYNTG
jgi:hypothetical protein